MSAPLRATIDTNVLLASQLSQNPGSPAVEIVQRWKAGQFTFLYSKDTAIEYAEKLIELGVPESDISVLFALLRMLGEEVGIEFFHLRHYPIDPKDIAFLLCALNGNATHLVTYDDHLLVLQPFYQLAFCEPVPFLKACRLSASP